MEVKYWSRAGLMLTGWCNARCASCYLCCGPERHEAMPLELALRVWEELIAASPHGCRVHLTGGEPFGSWPRLVELCREAKTRGLGPLESIETNAFWALEPAEVHDRLRALDEAGMGKLVISADPYHQQYVPIARPRLLARVAQEVLGAGRVQVRWRDWLEEGVDTGEMPDLERACVFAGYATRGRERMAGRAAEALSGSLQQRPVGELADISCGDALLRSRHVHVAPDGSVMPGTCGGLILGRCGSESVGEIWRRLADGWRGRPAVGTLAGSGPAELLKQAAASGFEPAAGYAGKCHLCWSVRRHLVAAGGWPEVGPAWMYEA